MRRFAYRLFVLGVKLNCWGGPDSQEGTIAGWNQARQEVFRLKEGLRHLT